MALNLIIYYQELVEQKIKPLLINFFFSQNHDSTIEDIYPALIVDEKGRKDKVHFFDTAGISVTKKFDSETLKNYVAYSDAIVMVYSIDNYDSFNVIVNLKKVIDKYKEKKEVSLSHLFVIRVL